MRSVTKNEMFNTSVIISKISINRDSEGRYSLNDLHKASGGEKRHEPNRWMRLDQTQQIIEEITNTQIWAFEPCFSRRGRAGGTFVCKELVYAYAMWVSAAFSLKVIRAYDEMMIGRAEQQSATQIIHGGPKTVVIHMDESGNIDYTEQAPAGSMVTTAESFKYWMEQNGWLVIRKEHLLEKLLSV